MDVESFRIMAGEGQKVWVVCQCVWLIREVWMEAGKQEWRGIREAWPLKEQGVLREGNGERSGQQQWGIKKSLTRKPSLVYIREWALVPEWTVSKFQLGQGVGRNWGCCKDIFTLRGTSLRYNK